MVCHERRRHGRENGMARTSSLCTNGGTAGPHNGRTPREDAQAGRSRRERTSSRAPFVVVMQTAEVWNGDVRATRRIDDRNAHRADRRTGVARLMIGHGVGVTRVAICELKRVDSDKPVAGLPAIESLCRPDSCERLTAANVSSRCHLSISDLRGRGRLQNPTDEPYR
jgi:hypothetical protein